jgi:hypothetical protein
VVWWRGAADVKRQGRWHLPAPLRQALVCRLLLQQLRPQPLLLVRHPPQLVNPLQLVHRLTLLLTPLPAVAGGVVSSPWRQLAGLVGGALRAAVGAQLPRLSRHVAPQVPPPQPQRRLLLLLLRLHLLLRLLLLLLLHLLLHRLLLPLATLMQQHARTAAAPRLQRYCPPRHQQLLVLLLLPLLLLLRLKLFTHKMFRQQSPLPSAS